MGILNKYSEYKNSHVSFMSYDYTFMHFLIKVGIPMVLVLGASYFIMFEVLPWPDAAKNILVEAASVHPRLFTMEFFNFLIPPYDFKFYNTTLFLIFCLWGVFASLIITFYSIFARIASPGVEPGPLALWKAGLLACFFIF